jgi:tetratricopeptide (TPR) repeat protein
MWTWRSPDSLYKPAPARADEWLNRAKQCEEQNRLPSAIKAYQHAARSVDQETAATACYHLGKLYEEQHRFSSALKAYRRAVTSSDRDTAASACFHLGMLYEHRHRRASAIGAYQRAVRLGGPDSMRAQHALARLSP